MIETLEKTIYTIICIAAIIGILVGMVVMVHLAIKVLRNE